MNDNHEKPYALTADPPIYTENEMATVKMDLVLTREAFRKARENMYEMQTKLVIIHHNVKTMGTMHVLRKINDDFSNGYNANNIVDLQFTINTDTLFKIEQLSSFIRVTIPSETEP